MRYLTAQQAAETLNVTIDTLYAYVSRRLIRSEAVVGSNRKRRYHPEDVQKLKQIKEQRRHPEKLTEKALHFGAPILESGITLIADGALYYRGRNVAKLAVNRKFGEVAALIWLGDIDYPREEFYGPELEFSHVDMVREHLAGLRPMERFQVALPLAALDDLAAYDLRPLAVARTGWRIVNLMTTLLGRPDQVRANWRAEELTPVGQAKVDMVNAAFILCADHELNISSFTARCVASAGSTPYAVVAAGLAALQGERHGGQVEQVEALLAEIGAEKGMARAIADRVIAERLKRGEAIPGFGHVLYPDGDPRARVLLKLLKDEYADLPAVMLATATAEAADELMGKQPTIDFAMAVLGRAMNMQPGTPLALFAIGRTIGLIGHAIEQYETGQLIRPRAEYTGKVPAKLGGRFGRAGKRKLAVLDEAEGEGE